MLTSGLPRSGSTQTGHIAMYTIIATMYYILTQLAANVPGGHVVGMY